MTKISNDPVSVEIRAIHRVDFSDSYKKVNVEYKSKCNRCHQICIQQCYTWSFVTVDITPPKIPKLHFSCSRCRDVEIIFELTPDWILALIDNRFNPHKMREFLKIV
jgi:hypothetical protein